MFMLEDRVHIPVMLKEVVDYLNLCPGMTVVDATIGTGGHSQAIVERIMPTGKIIGIDRDRESLEVAHQRLQGFSDFIEFVHANFSDLDKILAQRQIKNVDAVLFDLGISSFQLLDPLRGFSFQYEGPLDMRMDKDSYICAYDLLNNLNEEEISHLLWRFGQERWHSRIAHLLVQERQKYPIATTRQLADIVIRAIPSRYRQRFFRIHPATRTFQAIRIAVNRELEMLEIAINKAINLLNKNARICVISFHSLEDRIVKINFRQAAKEGILEIITPRPLIPSYQEIEINPSARSAKLRVAQRL